MTRPAPTVTVPNDWSEYQDEISDAISDSIDMDWSANDGARAVVRWLNENASMTSLQKVMSDFVSIPREPTEAMLEVLDDAAWFDEGGYQGQESSADTYRKLLAAAPAAPQAAGVGEDWTTLADLHTIKGWLHGLSTAPDLTEAVADGGVSAGDVYQQEAREFAGRLGRIIEAMPAFFAPSREPEGGAVTWSYDLTSCPRSEPFLIAYADGDVRMGHYLDNSKTSVPWQGIRPLFGAERWDAKIVAWANRPALATREQAPAEAIDTPEADELPGDFLARVGMDGKLWADEFRKMALKMGYSDMDEGWLLGWFCNAIMAGYDHALRAPSREPEGGAGMILKGVGKIDGDGWKDTTRKGEVVFVWNAEKPSPYAPGQYPRIGNEGWSASTAQYDFMPATVQEVRDLFAALATREEAPAEAGEVTADSLRSVSDETMRALLSCKDVGSGRAHLASIVNDLRAQPQARSGEGQ